MTPLITFILGVSLGYLVGLFAQEYFKPKAKFIEPKEYKYSKYTDEQYYTGKGSQFVESMTPKEKFNVAKNITDLL